MWMGMMYQGALAKFDRKTETIKTYSLPAQWNDDAAQPNMLGMRYDVDGKVWTDSAGQDRTPTIPSHEVSGTVAALGPDALAPDPQIAC